MPAYLKLPALTIWQSQESQATIRTVARKRVQCPLCHGFRRTLYILPSLVICCATCAPAYGVDPTHPDRPVSQAAINRARRLLASLAPLSTLAPDPVPPPLPTKHPRKRKAPPS